ncbi:type II toxin-antitoxin system Phd/YefM family antitoxin [Affinirhizobium pseudoryzae]|jgi:prevent-host-death family protein|uniref:type II toxin-antitoxin system Phd/YefM family antitoxin n=1 Tax=Allorhizobium pseudoryzae TaxID=379684 RepID=UPI0013ECBF47|nr:type II toxin-antitoxin system prevent-host-death family antitoxin [Allorhizobium pseudoryzae]
MKTVSLQEAQSHLARLVDEASKGDAFVIAKDGRPAVKVVPLPVEEKPVAKRKRRAGFLKGEASLHSDFDSLYAKDIEEMFYGK